MVLAAAAQVLACSSESTGFNGDLGYGAGNPGAGGPGGAAGPGGGVVRDIPGTTDPKTSPVKQACATGTAQAQPLPVHMVLMLDRSGSMCEVNPNDTTQRDCNNPVSKWQQVRSALQYFFANPTSSGMTATIVQFPATANGGSNNCDAGLYTKPAASLAPLPTSAAQVMGAIDSRASDNSGNTPTRDAMQGGLSVAATIRQGMGTNPGKVVALVATDGLPAGCPNQADNDVGPASQLASQANAQYGIPTYVLGVGNQLQNLDTLAINGGTQQAFIANTTNPAMVGQYVSQALESIRKNSLGCEYAIPPPPAGQTLDPAQVNVQYSSATVSGGLLYSANCANGAGWTYDNPAAPKQVKLCPQTCAAVQANTAGGRVDLVFGCQTQGDPVR